MLNINPGYNEKLLESCKTLQDYAVYTSKVRTYAKSMSLEEAVELAISECMGEDILADFLRKHRVEAKKMSIYEYDEEKHMCQEREESREEGIQIGVEKGRSEGAQSTLKLTLLLLKAGQSEDIERATREFGENVPNCRKNHIWGL